MTKYPVLLQSKNTQCVISINRLKKKIYMIISIDAENIFHKIQQSFMIKALNKLGIQGNFSHLEEHPLYTYSYHHDREQETGHHHDLEPSKDSPLTL